MSSDADIGGRVPSARAMRVFEDRNRAFRILYDTVMAVEGASEENVYAILCRNLRKICAARWATLSEYNPTCGTLTFKAADREDDDEDTTPASARRTAHVSEEMLGRYTGKQVRKCERHGVCPMEALAEAVFQDKTLAADTVSYCLSCVREGTLIAVAKVGLREGAKLKLKDLIDTYMNMAGMILQRVQAMRALRESEEKYREVVERANDGIVVVQDKRIEFANRQFERITGRSASDVIGTPFLDFVHPCELPVVTERHSKHIAGEDTSSVYETALQHDRGERVDVELNVGSVVYQDSPAELVIIRDITDRKQAEEELRQKNKQMERLNAELTILSRADPLTGLSNRRAWEEAVTREHSRFLRHGSTYCIIMIDIDNFKAYNDSCGHQAGDECLRKVATTIASSSRRVDVAGRYGGEEFAILAPDTEMETGIKLAERIRKAIWTIGLPHPASPIAGRVTISLGVADSTAGSWETVLKRADDGLYVAKKAGRNMVYGEPAGDRKPSPPEEERANPDNQTASAPECSASVLVVAGDPGSRDTCTEHLEREGYLVLHADNGAEAKAGITSDVPNVIIMDTELPDSDSLECVRGMKANPDTSDIPIILVSDRAGGKHIVSGLQAGADEYMVKPIRATELALRVRSMVRRHQDRRDLLRSYEVRGEHVRVLARLVEFCRRIGTSRCLDDVLDHTIAAVGALLQARRISIMLPDSKVERLHIRRSIGIDAKLAETIQVPIGKAVAGRVFATARPIVVNTGAEAPRDRAGYDSDFFASVPMLSTPLGSAERVVGVLNVTDRVGHHPFARHELGYIELIAGVASTAIHEVSARNARDRASDTMMVALVRLAGHSDNDNDMHVDRVSQYSRILAAELQKTEKFRDHIDDVFVENLVRSAPLHDIGKVAIPDQILLHPGRLAAEKMEVMRTHSAIGAETIRSLLGRAPEVGFLAMAADIAHYHHEWYDGSGYPEGLKAHAIPLAARIVALADVYDALVTERVYKATITHEAAVATIIEGSDTQFDPDVVEAFVRSQDQFQRICNERTRDELIES